MGLPSPDLMLARLLVLLFGFTWHELAHATAAWLLGDPTPKREGCLTLNPVRHLDPMGSLMLLLTGFGWSKTACINPSKMTRVRNPRLAMAIVAAAGPLMNLMLAMVGVVIFRYFRTTLSSYLLGWGVPLTLIEKGGRIFSMLIFIEVVLAFFNLVPIPPLDGAAVLEGIAAPPIADFIVWMRGYGPFFFLFFFFVLPFLGLDLLSPLIVGSAFRFLAFLMALLGGG